MGLIMKKIFFLILGIALSMTIVMSDASADEEKKGPKVRLGEFTGTSGAGADETKSDAPKGLTDDDIKFMYQAGVFEKPPGLFRQRFSIAYNLSWINTRDHFVYDAGSLAEREGEKTYSNGIAIQYNFGISLMRYFDWRNNPLLGVNFLLDSSFGFIGDRNITTLGFGGEVHFLWIFKMAMGYNYIKSNNMIFGSGKYIPVQWGNDYAIKDSKSTSLLFVQAGISIPVSKESDVFASASLMEEQDRSNLDDDTEIISFRAGVAWKF